MKKVTKNSSFSIARSVLGAFLFLVAAGIFFNYGHIESGRGFTLGSIFSISTHADTDIGGDDSFDDGGSTDIGGDDSGGDDSGGDEDTGDEPIPVMPICTLSASPSQIDPEGAATLSWTSSDATSASINQGVGKVTPVASGSKVVHPTVDTTYTGTFKGPDGTVTCSATVKIKKIVPPIACTLSANPTSILQGGSSTLFWTTTGATSFTINQGIGAVTPIPTGSTSVSPTATTTYTGTAKGPGGTVFCEATIKITKTPPPPVCTLSANPTLVASGATTTLTWTSSNVTTATINQGVGSISPVAGGNINTTVSTTTTYTGTFTGPGGTVTCNATVTVPPPNVPMCTMTIDKSSVPKGDSATLSWTSANVTSLTIDQGIGIASTTGSKLVTPLDNTTYTGTFTGPHGTITCQASIIVTTGGGGCIGAGCGNVQQPPNVVVYQKPNSQPLAFVYLSQIPYTGFPAGPFMTTVFWTLLIIWSTAIGYFFVYRGYWKNILPGTDSSNSKNVSHTAAVTAYDAAAHAPIRVLSASQFPFNLPTGGGMRIAPQAQVEPILQASNANERRVEERLFEEKILISKGGMSRIANVGGSEKDAVDLLEKVIYTAKRNYPREDGWILLSDSRIEEVFAIATPKRQVETVGGVIPQASTTTATAFVTWILDGEKEKLFGILRALSVQGHTTDELLTDAIMLLDSAYRARMEGGVVADQHIATRVERLATQQLEELIKVLSGAIDQIYSSSFTGAKLAVASALNLVAKWKQAKADPVRSPFVNHAQN